MKYIAKILFSNKKLSGWKINILEQEFIERREIAVDILNPMYEKWNKEFHELYPDKDGYSTEYSKLKIYWYESSEVVPEWYRRYFWRMW